MDNHANRHSRPSSSGSHDDDTSSTHPIFPPDRDRIREQERPRLMNIQIGPVSGASSAAASVNHGIAGSGGGGVEDFEKPMPPFMGISSPSRTFTNNSIPALNSGRSSPALYSPASEHKLAETDSQISLSTHYLPSKFSSTMLNPGARRRKGRGGKGEGDSPHVPKMGGGAEAFRSGEARMPVEGDEDYDGVNIGGPKTTKMRWNRFKWTLFVANLVLTAYSLVALVICLLTWFNIWSRADLVRIGNRPELVLSTLASSIGIFTSMIGWSGIVLNNRSFLAIYNLFLWITFLFVLIPGYMTYKRHTFNLEGKINAEWSRELGPEGRLRVQNLLQCCGYYSPFIEATVSQTCYSRSVLPGCKLHYLQFERMVLRKWYTVAFSIVPVHIGIIVAGLLCSNHVTYRFGKGMMPKAYRLSMNSMAVIMDHYAGQLAEQYGNDVASEIIAKSRSGWQLDGLPAVAYSQSLSKTPSVQVMMTKFDTIGHKGE